MNVQVSLSLVHHPAINSEMKKTNQMLQQYLICYCMYGQNNWPSLLPLAEFSYNNPLHISNAMIPFQALYSIHSRVLPKDSSEDGLHPRNIRFFARAACCPNPVETAASAGKAVTQESFRQPLTIRATYSCRRQSLAIN